jgi:hypothetical protein
MKRGESSHYCGSRGIGIAGLNTLLWMGKKSVLRDKERSKFVYLM